MAVASILRLTMPSSILVPEETGHFIIGQDENLMIEPVQIQPFEEPPAGAGKVKS